MRLIIDNNILFSLMNPLSISSKIFSILACEFTAPYFIIEEFNKYERECFKKSKLSKEEFGSRKRIIFSKINFIKIEEYHEFIREAINFSLDKDDAPYMALALKLKAPIWTNDVLLKKQNKIFIFNTKDLLDLINEL